MSAWPPRPSNPRPESGASWSAPRLTLTRRKWTIGIVIAAVVVLLYVLVRVLGMYVDWLWFDEVGFTVVFWTSLWSRAVVGVVFAILFFVIVWGNVELARRLSPRLHPVGADIVDQSQEALYRFIGKAALWGLGLLSLIVGYATSGSWLTFQRALHATSFRVEDPIFGHDLGFYIFSVPAWHYLQSFIFAALLVSLALAAGVHLLLARINLGDVGFSMEGGQAKFRRPHLSLGLPGRTIAHLSGLLGTVFVVAGVGQLFKAWDLLVTPGSVAFGATYTDATIRIPVTRVLMGVAFLLAAVLFANIWRRVQWWPVSIAAWVVVLVLAQWIVPAAVQGLIVNPNELAKERTYIGYNLEATRRAYDLTDIAERPLAIREPITADQLDDNDVTLRNIRLWDPDTLVTSYRQLQELRPYYFFVDADVDRYEVNGVLRQTMLSARELNIAGLPQNAQTWVNQHITYTHGYGVALSAVNQVTGDGSPDFLVKDIPPQAVADLKIDEPRIYFGEMGTDYTLVKTREKEFDYPGAGGDVYRSYSGKGGLPVTGFLNRLAFSLRYRTIKFFTTSALNDESRVIILNNISEMVATAAPFLQQDADPYMVIADGRLKWIIDCYTTTDRYAYSQPEGDLNYIRNSVKAVIDAYDGTLTLYAFDETDPLLRTYQGIFPQMFAPASEMPDAVRAHVRYPEDIFNVQARLFTTYHVTDPEVLYNKGDQWQVPDSVAVGESGNMRAYYVIMRLPGEEREEFLQILPFVPNGRKNMVSWLGARSDSPNYGTAVAIVLGKGSSVYGPSQVEAAINQDAKVSQQLTLWDRAGSSAIMGNLLVVPIAESLLYIQPLYLQAEQTKLPQLKQVIVFYQLPEGGAQGTFNQIVAMKPTLGEALTEVFASVPDIGPTPSASPSPGVTPTPTPSGSPTSLPVDLQSLVALANAQFEAAQAAQQTGDWAEYGRQIELLRQTLEQLRQLQ